MFYGTWIIFVKIQAFSLNVSWKDNLKYSQKYSWSLPIYDSFGPWTNIHKKIPQWSLIKYYKESTEGLWRNILRNPFQFGWCFLKNQVYWSDPILKMFSYKIYIFGLIVYKKVLKNPVLDSFGPLTYYLTIILVWIALKKSMFIAWVTFE